MSKNVAVFVDVANIFYAAKAGGVDIDYVTLLKSAVAGRDFVRAYAYTGLDPENENQRQFHSFLARSGYKVVSKDIRKYGDGRIKANLDIELVVDLMRLARNLDIAVVVSGDGDFAPAIRAVQEMGVRVEVISFRGNTSSDLIEVADQFTDIAQIARVEKASGRSGRRVAAEGDLSMTAVPEKETEGAPRRRRGRGTAADRVAEPVVAVAAADAGMTGSLIVLPGERLSRSPDAEEGEGPEEAAAEPALDAEGEAGDRRRRRRRGGRGRGRGRRDELQPSDGHETEPAAKDAEEEEDEDFEPMPAQPPHHAFGSVWDSQLGVPSGPPAASASYEAADEDEDLEEPEVPEYLLAERRQHQRGGARGGRMQRGGRQGAYQAALERERYGRSGGGAAAGGGGFGGSRLAERPRQDRGRGPRGGPGQRGPRQDRPPIDRRPAQLPPPAGGATGDPWSEVPADLEEMLRAELSRKAGSEQAASQQPQQANGRQPDEQPDEAPKPKRAARSRAKANGAAARSGAEDAATADGAPAKPKRVSRAKATASGGQEAEKPKRATRSRAKAADAPEAGAAGEQAQGAADGEAAPAKPARRRRTKADAEPTEG